MYIKGLTEYTKNGEEVKTACVFGRATKDGELRTTNNSKQIASVSVKAFGKKDGSAEFITVKAWGGVFANLIAATKKGDSMMACGRLEEREYNDKSYVDMMVDYYMRMPAEGSASTNFENLNQRVNDFNSDDDCELPF